MSALSIVCFFGPTLGWSFSTGYAPGDMTMGRIRTGALMARRLTYRLGRASGGNVHLKPNYKLEDPGGTNGAWYTSG